MEAVASARRAQSSAHLVGNRQLAVRQVSRARKQQLWNAAVNDEVNFANVGRPHSYDFVHQPFHRGKFLQQRKLEKEIATGKHHIITNPRDMDNIFEPLKWMHEQGEPAAVAPRQRGLRPSGTR